MCGKEIRELFEETKKDITFFQNKSYYSEKEECYLEKEDDVPLIRFRAFEPYKEIANIAFSTRFGGVSQNELAQLNLGFNRNDHPGNVEENYRRICQSMGTDWRKLVFSDQIHQTEVLPVGEKDTTGEKIQKKLKGIDGLITNEKVILATSYADCVPLLFLDPVKKVIAASHSGWKGTVGKIGAKTIQIFQREYGSKPKDIVVVIGPSICQNCYEVSEDVVLAFRSAYNEKQIDEIVKPSPKKEGKYYLDLWAANYLQFKEAGLLKEHIHVSGICTCHHPMLLFSHRATKGKRGNLNALMTLC